VFKIHYLKKHFHIYVMSVLLLEHFNKVIHVMLYLSAVYYLDPKGEIHLTWRRCVHLSLDTCSF